MGRLIAAVSLVGLLAACGTTPVEESPKAELGEFRLAHNVVIASKMQAVPGSRQATEEEWVQALTGAFDDRFGRYEGSQLYHFGVSVEGYNLGRVGIPVIAAPRTALIINVTIWDDAEAAKLNEEPHQMLVLESFDESSIIGSGAMNTREEQIANLAFNASRQLETWLSRQQENEGWFNDKTPEDAEIAPEDAETTPEDVEIAPEDSGITPEDAEITPEDVEDIAPVTELPVTLAEDEVEES